jgi:LPS-assembly protein
LKNYFEFTYAREVFIDQDSEADPSQKNEYYGVGLGSKFKWIDLKGQAIYSPISKKFDGWEYAALFKPPGECFTIKFAQKQTVGSDIDYDFSFNFEFGG